MAALLETGRQIADVDFLGDYQENFQVLGDANATKTYFLVADEGYQVEIPGYSDYVGAIFQLRKDQWRDRLVINGNWRSIQKLEVDYAGEGEDLSIRFADAFFEVSLVDALDSNAVINYLNEFEFLRANERISPGRFPRLDSLAQTAPEAIITIDDIKGSEPLQLVIFPAIPGDQFRLVLDPNNLMAVFEEERVRALLRRPADFKY